jgi:hypothetical protein
MSARKHREIEEGSEDKMYPSKACPSVLPLTRPHFLIVHSLNSTPKVTCPSHKSKRTA